MVLNATFTPSSFRRSVTKSELVSCRSGVSSSEPTAMISAIIRVYTHFPKGSDHVVRWRRAGRGRQPGAGTDQLRERKLREAQPFHAQRYIINSRVRRDDRTAARRKRQAHDSRSGDDQLRFVAVRKIRRKAEDAAVSAVRRGHIQSTCNIHRQALRPPQSAI